MLKLNRVAPSAGDRGLRPGVDVARNLPGTSVSTWLNPGVQNPLTLFPWHTAVWASDPLWTPPADGGSMVAGWRDGSGNGRTVNYSSGSIVYRASTPALNGRPTVNGTNFDGLMITNSFTGISPPITQVVIGQQTAHSAVNDEWIDAGTSGLTDRMLIGYNAAASGWGIFSGTLPGLTGGTADLNPHLFAFPVNGSTGLLVVDGAVAIAPGTTGAGGFPITKLALFSNPSKSAPMKGHIAFAGLYRGDITAHPNWPAFKAWARTYYGLTIA